MKCTASTFLGAVLATAAGDFRLATAGEAVPSGVAVWAPNPLVTVLEGPDYSDKNDPACAIRLATARDGAVSGQVVVFSKTPSKGAEASITDLKHKDGKATIPASAVEVRYALPTGVNGTRRIPAGSTGIFDALSPKPREQGSVHPVWVTVSVPSDAVPGEYEGTLSVAGRQVPVTITVAAWTMPKPEDFATWVDFIESPESVALRYEVPLWSDRHFELMAGCFRQLAKVGNKTLYLPLAGCSNLGNEHTVVHWVRTDNPKEFKHDFTALERYLDVCIKNAGKPQFVICHLYEDHYGGSMGRDNQPEDQLRGVQVSLLDPATGKTEVMEGPGFCRANEKFGDYPKDTIDFWKPVLDGILERMKARGLGDDNLAAGLSRDMMPGKGTADTLLAAAPCIKWVHHGHGIRLGLHKVMAPGFCTTVWNARMPVDPAEERYHGWQNKNLVLMNDRDIWKPEFAQQLVRSRLLGELNIAGKQRGFGRMSADLWPCLKDGKGNVTQSISARYPRSNWVQLNLRQTPYLHPGPDGALGTIRFEMLREGVEECEARIFIEKALLDPDAASKLGEELAKRCQDLLDDRVRALLAGTAKKGKSSGDALQESSADFAESPWQERSAKLYAAAAEVAAKLGSKDQR